MADDPRAEQTKAKRSSWPLDELVQAWPLRAGPSISNRRGDAGGMLGYELAQRAVLHRPGLKILFTSGYAHLSLRGGSDLVNEANFLSKPFRKRELAMKLRSVLKHQGEVAEPSGQGG